MRILVATDGSEASQGAIDAARSSFWPEGSTLRVLTVVQLLLPITPFYMEAASSYEQVLDGWRKDARERVARAAELLGRPGLTVETVVREGDPRFEIVDEAKSFAADLVLVGSHGKTGLERVLVGSVAEYVVRHAPCSVELVRTPQAGAQRERHSATASPR